MTETSLQNLYVLPVNNRDKRNRTDFWLDDVWSGIIFHDHYELKINTFLITKPLENHTISGLSPTCNYCLICDLIWLLTFLSQNLWGWHFCSCFVFCWTDTANDIFIFSAHLSLWLEWGFLILVAIIFFKRTIANKSNTKHHWVESFHIISSELSCSLPRGDNSEKREIRVGWLKNLLMKNQVVCNIHIKCITLIFWFTLW